MALLDKAIIDASVAFADAKDHVTGAALTPVATQMDPITSGCNYSYLFESGQPNTLSIPMTNLSRLYQWTVNMYLFFSVSATSDIVKFGANSFFKAYPEGYVSVTLPYSTPVTVNIDYDMEYATQISVSMTNNGYRVMIDGATRAEGTVNNLKFQSYATIDVASQTNAAIVVGAINVYETFLPYQHVQSHFLEAFASGPDGELWSDGAIFSINDAAQDYAASLSIPGTTPWESFTGTNVKQSGEEFGLKLSATEEYDTATNSFVIPNVGVYASSNAGSVKHRIPSFSTGAARGILYLKRIVPGIDEFAIAVTGANQIQAYRKQFTVDGSGNETSTWATYGAASTALTNGADLHVGFGWQDGSFSLLNGGLLNTIQLTDFDPKNYSAIFGSSMSDGILSVSSYYASRGAWVSELRALNYQSGITSTTEYGNHTFFTASTAEMPVRAEGSVVIESLMFDTVRKPYMLIDGRPNGSITEAILL